MLFLAEHTVRLSLQGTFSVYQLPQLYQHDNLCVLNSFFKSWNLGHLIYDMDKQHNSYLFLLSLKSRGIWRSSLRAFNQADQTGNYKTRFLQSTDPHRSAKQLQTVSGKILSKSEVSDDSAASSRFLMHLTTQPWIVRLENLIWEWGPNFVIRPLQVLLNP